MRALSSVPGRSAFSETGAVVAGRRIAVAAKAPHRSVDTLKPKRGPPP